MNRFAIAAMCAAAVAIAPAAVFARDPAPLASATAPLDELVAQVKIPYERFVLGNGLTTIVHTDRKAPIVGVTIYYRVGSRHEPRGRTGFAHLYEHLFFGGSANVEHFDKPLEAAGSTTTNGSTWYDRTNYVETVPKGALDLALFMESDRMGYLLPAVTQDKLDKQRNVVKNEKRQGDNQPYGLAGYATSEGLFPVGHPYRHGTIGSMADLEAATLINVREWFRDNYGPNNVVLVLTGDIDADTARPLVEKWFGKIRRGPEVKAVEAAPVTLAAPKAREMTDQVPVTRLTRHWSGPGLNHPDTPALQIGMHILGGLASSRLDNDLVRERQLAVSVSSGTYAFEKVSFIEAMMDVKPGTDRETAEYRFDAATTDFLDTGPTEDEVRRAVTSTVSAEIGALEMVGGFSGKGATLAEGELYSGDPMRFRKDLARMAALTPADIKAAMQRWVGRPVYKLNIVPGKRIEDGANMGGWGDEATAPAPVPDPREAVPAPQGAPERTAPPVASVTDLDFPDVERARLSNGIAVALARRTAIPKLILSLNFDAGIAGDVSDTPGTQLMMMAMLDEGAANLNATQIAEAQERLGATIAMSVNQDSSRVTLTALSDNLGPSLSLMSDIVRKPAFAEAEVTRVKAQNLAQLAHTLAQPRALASRELASLIYGDHPYAQASDGLGTAESLGGLTAQDLRAAHAKWLRPDLARITVSGNIDMPELLPLLERAFGDWQPPETPAPVKQLGAAAAEAKPRIVLIDRPGSPQSVIAAGRVLPVNGTDRDPEALELANEVLGGGFLSRFNSDLREEKGWSYGVYSAVRQPIGPRPFTLSAPVQADRTGDAIAAIREILGAFPSSEPLSAEELNRVVDGNIRGFPGRIETNASVLFAILDNDLLGRPDDYYETLADRYRALGAEKIEAAAARYLRADGLTYVVVGDAKIVEPQLESLGIPVEIRAHQKSPPPIFEH